MSIENENGDKVFEKCKEKLGKEVEMQQLSGKDLKELAKSDLKDLGIVVFKERNLLYQKIRELVNNNCGKQVYKNVDNEGGNAPTAYI